MEQVGALGALVFLHHDTPVTADLAPPFHLGLPCSLQAPVGPLLVSLLPDDYNLRAIKQLKGQCPHTTLSLAPPCLDFVPWDHLFPSSLPLPGTLPDRQ